MEADITLLQEENQRLRRQLLQLQRLETIGRLASGLAHDLNNSLTSIIGFAELALAQPVNGERWREYMDVVVQSGYEASKFTQQLLDYGRCQPHEAKLVSINTLIQRVVPLLNHSCKPGMHLQLELSENTPEIFANSLHFEQILLNLVMNGLDALQGNGTVTIRTERQTRQEQSGAWTVLKVLDTGIGMEPDIQSRIFDPFYTTKPRARGTGLGLAAVKDLVTRYQGKIEVKSTVGVGTIFTVYLPGSEKGPCKISELSAIESGTLK